MARGAQSLISTQLRAGRTVRDDGVERGRIACRREGVEGAPRGRREELELMRRARQEARDDDVGVFRGRRSRVK